MIRWSIEGLARSLAKVPKGARITSIDGRGVYAKCENCGGPVMIDTANIIEYADGIVTHKRCPRRRRLASSAAGRIR